ncbi:MAG TPA: hypothetical protein VND93_27665, partial [Myxococcales bacterium]|nr:hypothetical protein [Myxococcales bacterium]
VANTPALFDPAGSTVSVPEPAYRWRFGDGSLPGFRDRPVHAYLLPGGYRPALTLFDGLGQSAYAAVPVRWKDGQGRDPPSVSIQTGPLEARDGLDVALVAAVQNGSSQAVAAQWSLGNGSGADGASANATYLPGRYWATASAVDSNGLPATDKVEIAVSRDDKVPPHCLAAADPVVAFIGSGTSVKVDWVGIVSPGSRPLTSVAWNIDGTPSLTAATSRTYPVTGWHHGALTVVDEEGLRCTDTVAVLVVGPGDTVASAPPRILDPGLNGTSVCGQEYTGRAALASGSGPLTWSLPSSAQGMAVDTATGVLHWTPPPVSGVDHSTYALQVQGPSGTDKVSVDLPYSCPDDLSFKTLCGCGAGGGEAAAAGLIALGLWALRARARRRR